MREYQPDPVGRMVGAHSNYKQQYQMTHRRLCQLEHCGPRVGTLRKRACLVDVANKICKKPDARQPLQPVGHSLPPVAAWLEPGLHTLAVVPVYYFHLFFISTGAYR